MGPNPWRCTEQIFSCFSSASRLRAVLAGRLTGGSMSIREERRCEPRTQLHRNWIVCVESDRFRHRRAQLLDYRASGMRLALEGENELRPGERLEIHHPGTSVTYLATVAWSQQEHRQTLVGAQLLEPAPSMRQTC